MGKYIEKRQAVRHQIEVPIRYGHGSGMTRDISLSGVYFTTDHQLQAGQCLHMLMELQYAIPGKSLTIECQGQVLRTETKFGCYGIAAKIDEITYLH